MASRRRSSAGFATASLFQMAAPQASMVLGEANPMASKVLKPKPIFVELQELLNDQKSGARKDELEWKETSRWVKFEENVEDGGDRWSKPHVASLPMHAIAALKDLFTKGDSNKATSEAKATVLLDSENIRTYDELVLHIINEWTTNGSLDSSKKALVKKSLQCKHKHLVEKVQWKGEKGPDPEQEIGAKTVKLLCESMAGARFKLKTDEDHQIGSESEYTVNEAFARKLPGDTECTAVLAAEISGLDTVLSAFVRLADPVYMGELTEVDFPTRFVFVILGPEHNTSSKDTKGSIDNLSSGDSDRTSDTDLNSLDSKEAKDDFIAYHEVGRSLATAMSDAFGPVAYKAQTREELVDGLAEFIDDVTCLPAGTWDYNIRIEPPEKKVEEKKDRKKSRKQSNLTGMEDIREIAQMNKDRADSGLVRSGRLFGGLINDIKRKVPFFLSDFKDALHPQCLASFLFMYFAVLAPTITFGGLFGDATEDRISVIESLIGSMFVGMIYGFFSGQPLAILGPTGPVLVFETIVYGLCQTYGLTYLSFRVWIGVWVAVILLVLVATDASAMVVFITRFTEENFATLIGVIFIKSSFEKVYSIINTHPLHPEPGSAMTPSCSCLPVESNFSTEFNCLYTQNGSLLSEATQSTPECDFTDIEGYKNPSNVFMTSVLLFAATYMIATSLKAFKSAAYFPTKVRTLVSDFAVIIALLAMTGVDAILAVDTPKLFVPSKLTPTWEGRGWLINPFDNPWWAIPAAFVPALLATILVFMDQQITVVIVNRKEHLLKKGCGYHLDLCVVAIMIVVCSFFGFPWCEASTVPSINHVRSLTAESDCSAPGEKPQFLGIREQRVTHILVFLLIGCSVFMAPILGYIPMPVLFGVFLYMGVASLKGLQLVDRLSLFLMPKKYQPDLPYLRKVPILKVHLFTIIQIGCLAALWVIKDIKATSILFPIMLVVMVGVRKLLDFVFTRTELKMLDDAFPDFKRNEQINEEEDEDDGAA